MDQNEQKTFVLRHQTMANHQEFERNNGKMILDQSSDILYG